MKRCLVILLLTLVMSFLVSSVAFATTVIIDGQTLALSSEPIIDNGTTLVPMRAFFEAMGAKVYWNGDTYTIVATRGGRAIALAIDFPWAKIKDDLKTTNHQLILAPRIIEDTTYIPLRFVSEALSAEVLWDGPTETIGVRTNPDYRREPSKYEIDYLRKGIASDAKNYKEAIGGFSSFVGKDVWINANYNGWDLEKVNHLEKVTITSINYQPSSTTLIDTSSFQITLKLQDGSEITIGGAFPRIPSSNELKFLFYLEDPYKQYPKWSQKTWNAIEKQQVFIGMTKEQATMSWGQPKDINTTIIQGRVSEQWVYGVGNYLYFTNGVLDGIQN